MILKFSKKLPNAAKSSMLFFTFEKGMFVCGGKEKGTYKYFYLIYRVAYVSFYFY